MPRIHSRAAIARPETTKHPPTPEVVWQQPQETHLIEIHKNSTTSIECKIDVESQTSPMRKPYLKYPDSTRSSSWETKQGARQNNASMTPRNNNLKSNEMKLTWQSMTVEMKTLPCPSENNNFTNWRPTCGGWDYQWILHATLSHSCPKTKRRNAVCLSGIQEWLKIDVFVDLGAYFTQIAQKEFDIIKQQAAANIFKIDDPPNFQIQVANGQLEQPIATATL